MKAKTIILIGFITLFLCSCSTAVRTEPGQSDTTEECIPPLITFSYPDRVHSETVLPDQPPRSPWQEVKEVPEDNFARIPFLTRKEKGGGYEIWFVNSWGNIEDVQIGASTRPELVYHTAANEWERVDNYFEGGQIEIFGVYELANGKLIADGFSETEHFLGTFDEEKRVFVENTSIKDVPYGPLIFDEERQIFWVFVQKDGIYSVDPLTLRLSSGSPCQNCMLIP